MSTQSAAETIFDDAMGIHGDLDRYERIKNASGCLIDFVWEYLADDGIDYGTVIDANVYAHIEALVAIGMMAQHKFDEERWANIYEDCERLRQQAMAE